MSLIGKDTWNIFVTCQAGFLPGIKIKRMNLIYSAIAIFGMAAVLGSYLLSHVLQNKEIPKVIALIHGLFAATGLVLLIIYCLYYTPGPIESVTVFAIAGMGGLILIYIDLSGNKIPGWLAVVHGTAAVTGFILLLMFGFG